VARQARLVPPEQSGYAYSPSSTFVSEVSPRHHKRQRQQQCDGDGGAHHGSAHHGDGGGAHHGAGGINSTDSPILREIDLRVRAQVEAFVRFAVPFVRDSPKPRLVQADLIAANTASLTDET
jgi:hypothetical protein